MAEILRKMVSEFDEDGKNYSDERETERWREGEMHGLRVLPSVSPSLCLSEHLVLVRRQDAGKKNAPRLYRIREFFFNKS